MGAHQASTARFVRVCIAASAAIVLSYIIIWSQITSSGVGASDFSASYVGATLLANNREAVYDPGAQAALRTSLTGTVGYLPFVDAPIAAVLLLPALPLGLVGAFYAWSTLMFALLVAAVFVAIRSAPWPAETPRSWKIGSGAVAIAALGTLEALVQAQWGAVLALGIAVAYRDWRRGHQARGAAALVACAAVAKPHLALGLVAFMLGWRTRGVVKGALIGGVMSLVGSAVVVGPGGLARFLSLATASNAQWPLRTFIGAVGIPGSLLGNGPTAVAIGWMGSALALVLAFRLGAAVRQDVRALDGALAAAVVLSILAAPHVYTHDLVLLAPPVAWMMASAIREGTATKRVRRTASSRVRVLLGSWCFITIAAVISNRTGALPLGQLTPWALITLVVVLHSMTSRAPASRHSLAAWTQLKPRTLGAA
jgi:hypothetical protein